MPDVLCVVSPFGYGPLNSIGPKCPNLGIGMLAAVLEEARYDVGVLDCFGLELTKEDVIRQLKEQKPSIILIGAVTANMRIGMELLSAAKRLNPEVITVIGGPHVTGNPESALTPPGIVDYVVMGEAEETIVELLAYIKGNSPLQKHEIKGIMYFENGQRIRTPDRGIVKKLDRLPMPAYHLFPMERYHSYGWLNLGRKFSTMSTSRGCPFKCSFCQSSWEAVYWRQRSAEKVFEEVRLLYERYGVRHIYFQDDDFCANPDRVIAICRMIKEAKLDLAWECLTRVTQAKEDMLKEMAEAGCRTILYGVETGYEEGFKRINKPISLQMVIGAVRRTQEHGILVRTSYIMGFPWEGEKEMRETIRFAKKVDADLTYFNIINPYPGTPIYDEIVSKGLFLDPENFDNHIIHGTDPMIRTEKLTAKQVRYWVGRAVLEFYLRPSFLLRRLFKVRSWQEFKANFAGGNDLLLLSLKKVLASS